MRRRDLVRNPDAVAPAARPAVALLEGGSPADHVRLRKVRGTQRTAHSTAPAKANGCVLALRFNRGRRRYNFVPSRFRRLWLRLRRRLGCCCPFFVFLYQAAHGVRRLGALADPVFRPFNIQRTIMTRYLRVVRADDLDKFAVAWAAAVGHYHFVIRAIFCAFST